MPRGLIFPVSRIRTKFLKSRLAKKLGLLAPLYMASVLEYLASEILDLAGQISKERNCFKIKSFHLRLAFQNDEELN